MKKPGILKRLFILFLMGVNLQTLAQDKSGRGNCLHIDANHDLLKPDAPFLTVSVPMETAKDSPVFLAGVGGVSFDQVGIPADNLRIASLSMHYNRTAEDGSRLELMINQKAIKVVLPDWMLVPIAKYADSPNYSCFTLFGKLNDGILEKQITEQKGRVMNYHPAFDNTLLGFRLAYIDMLVCYPFTCDLPKNDAGEYVLGTGERRPDIQANNNGAYLLSQHSISVESKHGFKFRSYVITDYLQQIKFGLKGDSLDITGNPYFYCWKFKRDLPDYDMKRTADRISAKCSKEILSLSESSGDKAVQDWLIGRLVDLAKKYDGIYNFYSEGTFLDMIRLRTDSEKAQFLERFDRQSLVSMVETTETHMDRDAIIPLKEYSNDFSSKPELFAAANPAVWNATINTMRFAAFFRYVKKDYPQAWNVFLEQVRTLDPAPMIETPTIMFDPDNKAIAQAILDSKTRGTWKK